MDFPHEVRFSAGIGPAHFPAEMTRPLGRGHLPFLPTFECPFTSRPLGRGSLPFSPTFEQSYLCTIRDQFMSIRVFIRSRISRIGFSTCPKETSGHCFADHWDGNHGRLALLISHTHLSSLTTNLHVSSRIFLFLSRPHLFVDSRDSWS